MPSPLQLRHGQDKIARRDMVQQCWALFDTLSPFQMVNVWGYPLQQRIRGGLNHSMISLPPRTAELDPPPAQG